MGAHYGGYLAKTFLGSSRDGNYKTKSRRAHEAHTVVRREHNNQLGLDACFEQTSSVKHIPSPVKLSQ